MTDKVTIEGFDWKATMTRQEHAEWERYADTHAWLLFANYKATLTMFLSHLRQGVNLNETRNTKGHDARTSQIGPDSRG